VQVLGRLLAQQRVVGQRAEPVGGREVRDRAVERTGAAAPHRSGVLAQQRLQVGAGVGVEHRQHLGQRHRAAGLGDRHGAAVLDRLGLRRARLEVDEEVALEQDARPDLHVRVLVHRQRVLPQLHRDPGGGLAAVGHLDLRDLADLHPGLAHRRAGLEVLGVADEGPQLVRVGKRVRLGEPEVDGHKNHHERQHTCPERAHGTSFRLSMPSWRDL
jgi:hypothetical protein